MPKAYAIATLPHPKHPRIRVGAIPPKRVAIVRFSGVARPNDREAKATALKAWTKRRALRVGGVAALAQYDPPWTLWVLRQNRALIPRAS